ncbi:MAG: hypothetical protein PVI23_08905 [Maricaulaceae bacterium]|jgi:hypothetical protein
MVFRRLHAERREGAASREQGAQHKPRSDALKQALMQDGLAQIVQSIEALHALEQRLQLVEDEMTAGDALSLPELPQAKDVGITETEPRFMEAALLIGAITRRMNLRLGAIERGLDEQLPLAVKPLLLESVVPDVMKGPSQGPSNSAAVA